MNDHEKITISRRSFHDLERILPKIGLEQFTQIVSEKIRFVQSLSPLDIYGVLNVQANFAQDQQVELSSDYLSETLREPLITACQKHSELKPGTLVEMAILKAELESLSLKNRSPK